MDRESDFISFTLKVPLRLCVPQNRVVTTPRPVLCNETVFIPSFVFNKNISVNL